MIANCIHI